MSNTLKLGNGQWATGKDTLLGYNSENNNIKPLPFSFSRDTSATVVNKDGLIETVGSGEPRIDFKDNTKGALLLEPSRSNLIPYSNFDDGWELSNTTRTLNNSISPDGNLNAVSLKSSTSSSNEKYIRRYVGVSASTDYTFSVFAKKNELSEIRLSSTGNSNAFAFFNLSNGTIGSVGSSATAKIDNFGNGWYKCSIKHQNSITGIFSVINLSIDGSVNISTNVNDGVYLFGSQYEQGSYPTSYIPTSGQSGGVTRVADSSSQTLPSSVFNSYPFSVFVEVDVVDTSSGYAFSLLNKASSSNYFTIEYYLSKWHIVARPSGSTKKSSSLEILTKGIHKLVAVYTDTNLKLYLNGSLIASGSNTQSFNSNIDSLLLGQLRISGDTNSRNTVRQTELYNNALTDAEAIALTQ